MWLLLLLQRHQESYMRRELQWEATVARLQQQLAQLKGEGNHKAAEDAAEGQAKQLNTIRSGLCPTPTINYHKEQCSLTGVPANVSVY